MLKRVNATYADDGSVEIGIWPDGGPVLETVVPAPCCDDAERERRLDTVRKALFLDGLLIVKETRVRNQVMDRGNERTSTLLKARAPRNRAEAAVVGKRVAEIVRLLVAGKKETCGNC